MKTLIFILFCPIILNGQNLIPNPSFEDTLPLVNQYYLARSWIFPTIQGPEYHTPHNTTNWTVPDNFTGSQNAKNGQSYMGIKMYSLYNKNATRIREYLQAKLIRPLQFDSTYCLRLYVSLADSVQFASRNQLSVYFSNTAVSANTNFHLPYTPQIIVSPNQFITDKTNWVEFNFQYQAMGGEEYITIGNFNDTTLLDTMYVSGGINQSYVSTYYYLDDLWLSHCDSVDFGLGMLENSLQEELSVYPNPFQDEFVIHSKQNQKLNFRLFDALGKDITSDLSQLSTSTSLGVQFRFSVGDIPKGIYLLHIDDGKEITSIKLIKN